MKVTDWSRWQRAKALSAGALFAIGIILIGGLEGVDFPPTTSWGLLCGIFSVILFKNVLRHDQRINPDRYDVEEEEWQ